MDLRARGRIIFSKISTYSWRSIVPWIRRSEAAPYYDQPTTMLHGGCFVLWVVLYTIYIQTSCICSARVYPSCALAHTRPILRVESVQLYKTLQGSNRCGRDFNRGGTTRVVSGGADNVVIDGIVGGAWFRRLILGDCSFTSSKRRNGVRCSRLGDGELRGAVVKDTAFLTTSSD